MSETATHKPGFLTKIAYGIGGMAGGVKNNGFDYALLIFYSQVLGLPGLWVGAAIWIALIVGTILNLINQGDKIFGTEGVDVLKCILTYMVPYCVATYSAVMVASKR